MPYQDKSQSSFNAASRRKRIEVDRFSKSIDRFFVDLKLVKLVRWANGEEKRFNIP